MADTTAIAPRIAVPPDPWRWPLRVAAALILIGLALYGMRCVGKGWYEPPDPSAPHDRSRAHRGSDFTAYYSAGEMVRTGGDLYSGWRTSSTPFRPYLYPPMFAIFPMAPLSLLGHNGALIAFYVLNIALLFGSFWMLHHVLWPAGVRRPPPEAFWGRPNVGLFLAFVCCARFFDANFGANNANVIILFLLVLGLYLQQSGRGLGSGVSLALATVYKLTPGLFGMYLLWSRRPWAMAGGALGLALFLFGIPSLVLGHERNMGSLTAVYRYATGQAGVSAAPGSASGGAEPTAEANANGAETVVGWAPGEAGAHESGLPRAYGISLRGTCQKLFSESVARNHAEDDPSVNVLSLGFATAGRIGDGLGLLLLLATIVLTLPRATRTGHWGPVLSWSLLVATMLLIAPLTRKAHGTVMLIPAAALVALVQQDRQGGLARTLGIAALLVLGVGGTLTSPDIVGDYASTVAHGMGFFTFSILLVWIALALAVRTQYLEESGGPQDKGWFTWD